MTKAGVTSMRCNACARGPHRERQPDPVRRPAGVDGGAGDALGAFGVHAEDHHESACGEQPDGDGHAGGGGGAGVVVEPKPEGGEAGGSAVGEVVLAEGEGEAQHAENGEDAEEAAGETFLEEGGEDVYEESHCAPADEEESAGSEPLDDADAEGGDEGYGFHALDDHEPGKADEHEAGDPWAVEEDA